MSNYRICLCVVLATVCLSGGKVVGRSFQKTQAGLGVKEKLFGRMPDGREVTLYELKNANGVRAGIINYGAILVSLEVPDRDG
ncbi:MAG: galactose-1-epimerase, partial [Planctomycetota bacterium]